MSMNSPDVIRADYEALRTGTAVLARPDAQPLSVRGADRADFLHRMTTNDVNSLLPGQSTVTVLTTPTARIHFVFTVLCREDDLLLLPAPGESETLERHLRGQIFFMDQVEIEPLPDSRWRIMGPTAAETLTALDLYAPEAGDGVWWEADGVLLVQQDDYDVPGFELVSPADAGGRLVAALENQGAAILGDEAAYTVRRVELGRPAAGRELTDQYNPLEAGMQWACAGDKGCYTGQEIIARQVTYDKVTKTLVGLVCDAAVGVGDEVTVDGTAAGQVTSAAYSPSLERHLALAIVRRPHNAPGTLASVDGVQVHIAELPFV